VAQANAEDNLAEVYLEKREWNEALELLTAAIDHLAV